MRKKTVIKPKGLDKFESEVRDKGLDISMYYCDGQYVVTISGSDLRRINNGIASQQFQSDNIGYLLADAREFISAL